MHHMIKRVRFHICHESCSDKSLCAQAAFVSSKSVVAVALQDALQSLCNLKLLPPSMFPESQVCQLYCSVMPLPQGQNSSQLSSMDLPSPCASGATNCILQALPISDQTMNCVNIQASACEEATEQPQQKLTAQPQQIHGTIMMHADHLSQLASQQTNLSQYNSQPHHAHYAAEMQAGHHGEHDSLSYQEEHSVSQHVDANWSEAGPEARHRFAVQSDHAAAGSMWNSTAQLQHNANTRQYSQSVCQEHSMAVFDCSQGYDNSSGHVSQALMASQQPCSYEALQYEYPGEPQDMPQEPPGGCHAEQESMLVSGLTRQDGQDFWHEPNLSQPAHRHVHTVDNQAMSTDYISSQILPEDSVCAPQQFRKRPAIGTVPLGHASSIEIPQSQAQSDQMQSNQHQLDTYSNSEAPYLPKHIQLQSSQHQNDTQNAAAAAASQAGAAAETSPSDKPKRSVITPRPATAARLVSSKSKTHKAGSADLPSSLPTNQSWQTAGHGEVPAAQQSIAAGTSQQGWKRAKRVSDRQHLAHSTKVRSPCSHNAL